MKKFIKISVIVIIALVVIALAVAEGFLRYALKPKCKEGVQTEWTDSVLKCGALRDTFIVSRTSGDSLHAYYLRADSTTNKVAVLIHGYTDRAISMGDVANIYDRLLHYNILMPDLHYHGQSQGDYVQMGCLDRLDVLQWCGVADTLFGNKNALPAGTATEQVLHGISMGAATVMSVSGENLPPYIKCFVEDCGYTSVWDEFTNQLHEQFSLPPFPLLNITSALCKVQLGWSFDDITPLQQVAKCRKPMLFIHGDNDTFVVTSMVYQLYKVKSQPKQIWISPGSAHAKSVKDHPEEYARQVVGFVTKYM